jgi:hypothetical protein
MYPLRKHIEASCTSLEIDSKLTVKPLKTGEKMSTSEHTINRPEGTETNTGAHRASRVVSPFFLVQRSRQSSDRCLELQNVLCRTFVYFQEPCLRVTVHCHVGLLKCWITEEIEQASSTRTGGTRDVLQPGSCERAMYTPFFFMSQIMTQKHCLPA